MNDTGSFVAAVLRELAASTAVILAAWGALGGATNALTTKMHLRDALSHNRAPVHGQFVGFAPRLLRERFWSS
jgi:hypothetical protein